MVDKVGGHVKISIGPEGDAVWIYHNRNRIARVCRIDSMEIDDLRPTKEDDRELLAARLDNLQDEVWRLRDLVWGKDIPSPKIPEYAEHHEAIQEILRFIDDKLLAKFCPITTTKRR